MLCIRSLVAERLKSSEVLLGLVVFNGVTELNGTSSEVLNSVVEVVNVVEVEASAVLEVVILEDDLLGFRLNLNSEVGVLVVTIVGTDD